MEIKDITAQDIRNELRERYKRARERALESLKDMTGEELQEMLDKLES